MNNNLRERLHVLYVYIPTQYTFIFRQSVLISLLVKVEALPEAWKQYDLNDVDEGLQNFIICVEMLLFAIAHFFVFSHKPFIDPAAAQVPCITSCLRMLDIRDVADDVREHFVDPLPRPKLSIIKRRSKFPKEDTGSSENTPLVNNDDLSLVNGTVGSDLKTDQGEVKPSESCEKSLDYTLLTYGELDPKVSQVRMSGYNSCDEILPNSRSSDLINKQMNDPLTINS